MRSLIIGIDPGTVNVGWAVYDTSTETFLGAGHDDWQNLRTRILMQRHKLVAVTCESVIIQSYQRPNQSIVGIAQNIGRIQQLCDDLKIDFYQMARIDICEKVGGIRPKRGVKVTKTDMQNAVQKLLNLDKVIRPQHANDAACTVLAFFPPQGI